MLRRADVGGESCREVECACAKACQQRADPKVEPIGRARAASVDLTSSLCRAFSHSSNLVNVNNWRERSFGFLVGGACAASVPVHLLAQCNGFSAGSSMARVPKSTTLLIQGKPRLQRTPALLCSCHAGAPSSSSSRVVADRGTPVSARVHAGVGPLAQSGPAAIEPDQDLDVFPISMRQQSSWIVEDNAWKLRPDAKSLVSRDYRQARLPWQRLLPWQRFHHS